MDNLLFSKNKGCHILLVSPQRSVKSFEKSYAVRWRLKSHGQLASRWPPFSDPCNWNYLAGTLLSAGSAASWDQGSNTLHINCSAYEGCRAIKGVR